MFLSSSTNKNINYFQAICSRFDILLLEKNLLVVIDKKNWLSLTIQFLLYVLISFHLYIWILKQCLLAFLKKFVCTIGWISNTDNFCKCIRLLISVCGLTLKKRFFQSAVPSKSINLLFSLQIFFCSFPLKHFQAQSSLLYINASVSVTLVGVYFAIRYLFVTASILTKHLALLFSKTGFLRWVLVVVLLVWQALPFLTYSD